MFDLRQRRPQVIADPPEFDVRTGFFWSEERRGTPASRTDRHKPRNTANPWFDVRKACPKTSLAAGLHA
jgi:hypothetical protein